MEGELPSDSTIFSIYNESNIPGISTAGATAGISGGSTSSECPFTSYSNTESDKFNNYPFYILKSLFTLEHNRIANELEDEYPGADDEWLFQEARARNIALFQKITYTEYLPLFIAYPFTVFVEKYNSSYDATATTLFCSLAHRYAHSASPDRIPFGGYHDAKGAPQYGGKSIMFHLFPSIINKTIFVIFVVGHIGSADEIISSVALRDTFDHPCVGADQVGSDKYLESLLAGLALEEENHAGTAINEDMRSRMNVGNLKGITATSKQQTKWWDIFAADILRSRDYGIPSYNNLRRMFDLDVITKWEDLTNDTYYLKMLPLLYDDVEKLDGYVGGLMEGVEASNFQFKNGSAHVGPLFAKIAKDQYYRLIAGDRLFYEWNSTLKSYTNGVTLSDVIKRNTALQNLSNDLMTADAENYYAQLQTEMSSGLFFIEILRV